MPGPAGLWRILTAPLTRSVQGRIIGGFAVILALLAALAVVSLRGTATITTAADGLGQDSARTDAVAAIAMRIEQAHGRVAQYTVTATMADRAAAEQSLVSVDSAIADGRAAESGAAAALAEPVQRYRQAVEAMFAAVAARNAAVVTLQESGTELHTVIGAIASLLQQSEDADLLHATMQFIQDFADGDVATIRFVTSHNPTEIDIASAALQAMRDHASALAAAGSGNRRLQRFLASAKDALGRYTDASQAIIAGDQRLVDAAKTCDAATVSVLQAAEAQRQQSLQSRAATIAAMIATTGSVHRVVLLTASGTGVFGLGLAVLLGTGIARPTRRLTSVMGRLANGQLDTDIPHASRRDELGAMARAVVVFREGMRAERTLTRQQEEQRARSAADKRAALEAMTNTIETELQSVIEQVSHHAGDMVKTADGMGASARRTGDAVTGAQEAASQALETVRTVAGAAEALDNAIQNIGGQVTRSTELVRQAVDAGEHTRSAIERLNQQVEQIGSIADLIGQIAARTNLLALNATIEAARAGDAGKGFAVVAGEVKSLAAQTARSTGDINRFIGGVRAAVRESADAVAQIERTIAEVNSIAAAIATAVEQQNAATGEIARNVIVTSSAAQQVNGRTEAVSEEVRQVQTHANEVRAVTDALTEVVATLRRRVVAVLRGSSTEIDRRQSPRRAAALPGRLTVVGGIAHPVQVADISTGGARLLNAPPAAFGAAGTLTMDGLPFPLPLSVRSGAEGRLNVTFTLDPATEAAFEPWPDRLTGASAA